MMIEWAWQMTSTFPSARFLEYNNYYVDVIYSMYLILLPAFMLAYIVSWYNIIILLLLPIPLPTPVVIPVGGVMHCYNNYLHAKLMLLHTIII